MRRAALISMAAVLAAGCAPARQASTTTTSVARPTAPGGLAVGVVGPLSFAVAGARIEHGRLADLSGARLVLASAASTSLAAVAAAASAHPATHYAFVGGSTKGSRRGNLVGLVLRDDQAALLGGVVAGLVAQQQGGANARVAWIGPEERKLAAAFARGVHESLPRAAVLHGYSKRIPSRCKEAALGAVGRGAVIVMAHGGACAAAAADGAHQQDHVALGLSDFEVPEAAATIVTRDAVAGAFHGGEDLVFGAASGAIGVRRLDPAIPPATAALARAAAQELASGLRPSG
jgi:basic membrane lipoprotein Med (substrate-binding protein (PBP1-ABC) superfamily)